MKARYIIAALLLVVAGLQTTKAQKVRLYYDGKLAYTQDFEGLESITFSEEPVTVFQYVDLGLPSGTLWATTNIGANTPEQYGSYFAWGESKAKVNYVRERYEYYGEFVGADGTNYVGFTKYNVRGAWAIVDHRTVLEPADDAATVNMGEAWQMPSPEQFDELINGGYTTAEWTTLKGVYGLKVTSNSDTDKSIFLPAAGSHEGTTLNGDGSNGYYWSRSLDASATGGLYDRIGNRRAQSLSFNSSGSNVTSWTRESGLTIRPVRAKIPEYVDLGLPHGTLWATCNVGAESPEGYGDYYAWGEMLTKDYYSWDTYQYCYRNEAGDVMVSCYCSDSQFGMVDNQTELVPGDDIATVKWGKNWQTPSREQIDELIQNTTFEWTTLNGVYGCRATSKTDTSKSIFLPAVGVFENGEVAATGEVGAFQSRTVWSEDSKWFNCLSIGGSGLQPFICHRCIGLPVRPVRKQ